MEFPVKGTADMSSFSYIEYAPKGVSKYLNFPAGNY